MQLSLDFQHPNNKYVNLKQNIMVLEPKVMKK